MLDNSNIWISTLQCSLRKFDIKGYFAQSSVSRSTFYFLFIQNVMEEIVALSSQGVTFFYNSRRLQIQLYQ